MMKIVVDVKFNGVKNDEEFEWAVKQFGRVNRVGANICNSCIIPIYNFIWTKMYPNDNMIDHPNYDRIYKVIASAAFGLGTLLHGINWKTKRKIVINPLGNFEDDYISIKNL